MGRVNLKGLLLLKRIIDRIECSLLKIRGHDEEQDILADIILQFKKELIVAIKDVNRVNLHEGQAFNIAHKFKSLSQMVEIDSFVTELEQLESSLSPNSTMPCSTTDHEALKSVLSQMLLELKQC
jgi:hypothetical protein